MIAGVIVLIAVLAGASAFGFARRRREGRLRAAPGSPAPAGLDLGAALGHRATLLQFSSSFCAPCRAARHLLADVAAHRDGVAHIEIDVAERMDLVRSLDIRRTPTVLVLDPAGRVAGRAAGVPRRGDVLAALAVAQRRDSGPGRA